MSRNTKTSVCNNQFMRFFGYNFLAVLKQLPPRKIATQSKTNPNPNPNPNQGVIFLRGNCLVAPNPKTNPNLDRNPNPNRGAIFLAGNGPDTLFGYSFFSFR